MTKIICILKYANTFDSKLTDLCKALGHEYLHLTKCVGMQNLCENIQRQVLLSVHEGMHILNKYHVCLSGRL